MLVKRLVGGQFPQWGELAVVEVKGGWDNWTFRLGEELVVRLPKGEAYAGQVEKEATWLGKLAGSLSVEVPEVLAVGEPDLGYAWNWSVRKWIDGERWKGGPVEDLARFLKELQGIDACGGPVAGLHSFYRGGSISVYDDEVRRAVKALGKGIDGERVMDVWERALSSSWEKKGVWVHGDVSAGNLLVRDGKLCGVIDFGQLAVGDPACDLVPYWTLFEDGDREKFREAFSFEDAVWERARGWALWKAIVVAAGFTNPNNTESKKCWQILEVLERGG